MSPDKLVMMANQIGKFFASQGSAVACTGHRRAHQEILGAAHAQRHLRPSRRRRRGSRSAGEGRAGESAQGLGHVGGHVDSQLDAANAIAANTIAAKTSA